MVSYKVTKEEPEGTKSESPSVGMRKMMGETKGLSGAVSGSIGEVKTEPVVSVENLTPQAEEQRQEYIGLLQTVLIPHKLHKLASKEENQERLFSKLDRLTLGELKAFMPSKLKVGEIDLQSVPANVRAEINMRYKDISP